MLFRSYYMDVDFYRYFIGREDQSVNEKVMIKRLDQQIFVTKTMIDMYQLKDIGSKKLRQYMLNYLAIMMTVSSILCIRSKNKENLDMPGIEKEVERIMNLWIEAGVTIFRIDNPHTKPVRFWQDVIAAAKKRRVEVSYAVGDQVTVTDGPFATMAAVVSDVEQIGRAHV